jgi:hypothetical protein
MFLSSSFVDSDIGVSVDLIALDDVLVGHLLAGLGVDFGVLDAVPVFLLIEDDLLVDWR